MTVLDFVMTIDITSGWDANRCMGLRPWLESHRGRPNPPFNLLRSRRTGHVLSADKINALVYRLGTIPVVALGRPATVVSPAHRSWSDAYLGTVHPLGET